MSIEKFTQGDWVVVEKEANGVAHIVRMNTPNLNRYDARPYAALGGFPDENAKKEIEANAHLIAAAPDMYHMLMMLQDDDSISDPSIDKEVIKLLAKARGENDN